jgi:hypothetical protein
VSKFDTSWKAGTSWVGSWEIEAAGKLGYRGPGCLAPWAAHPPASWRKAGPHNYYGIIFIFLKYF